jgi:diacylglycerol kinase family enzyme
VFIIKGIHILNPAAGKGRALYLAECAPTDSNSYITKGIGDAERFAYEQSLAEKELAFVVCGGDGTLNEVINGVMRAKTNNTTEISMVATGSGNDFVRNFNEKGIKTKIDLMKYNGRYAVNVINTGFDSQVVIKMSKYRRIPLVSGSLSYILAVAEVFFKRIGKRYVITLTDTNGELEILDGMFLSVVVANGSYYGGGFKAAPLASLNDGLIDVIMIKKVGRLTFLKLVSSYQKGTHMDPETGQLIDKFDSYLTYRQCTNIKIKGMTEFAADGEIEHVNEIEVSIVPEAINFVS